jgi:hypothetical protein
MPAVSPTRSCTPRPLPPCSARESPRPGAGGRPIERRTGKNERYFEIRGVLVVVAVVGAVLVVPAARYRVSGGWTAPSADLS